MKTLLVSLMMFQLSQLSAKEMGMSEIMNVSKRRHEQFLERRMNLATHDNVKIDRYRGLRKSSKPNLGNLEAKERELQYSGTIVSVLVLGGLKFLIGILGFLFIGAQITEPSSTSSTFLSNAPSSVPSSTISNAPSNVPLSTVSGEPSLAPSSAPSIISSDEPSVAPSVAFSSSPSSDVLANLSKTWYSFNNLECESALVSSDGNSMFIMFSNGPVHWRKSAESTWLESQSLQTSLGTQFESRWENYLSQLDFLHFAISADGNNVVSINNNIAQALVFYVSGDSWVQRGDVITNSSALVPFDVPDDELMPNILDISNDGLSILIGSTFVVSLITYDTSWEEVGFVSADFDGSLSSEYFFEAKMNSDASTAVVCSYHFESQMNVVKRYSLPAFEEIVRFEIESLALQVSLSESGNMIGSTHESTNGLNEQMFQLYVYEWDGDAQEYIEQAVLEDYGMYGDLIAGDGPAFLAYNVSTFGFDSFVLDDGEVEETGNIDTFTEFDFFPSFSVSADGCIFLAVFDGVTFFYEAPSSFVGVN